MKACRPLLRRISLALPDGDCTAVLLSEHFPINEEKPTNIVARLLDAQMLRARRVYLYAVASCSSTCTGNVRFQSGATTAEP
jgi:hypothetical protein